MSRIPEENPQTVATDHDHDHHGGHDHNPGLGHNHGHGHEHADGQGDGHSHGLGGHHHHAPADFNRAFAIGVVLNTIFVVIEAVFGFLAGSLALVADAGHNLSDVLSLLLAWGAHALARREATPRRTYGYRRATILAALTSAILLLLALGGITWEAIERLVEGTEVAGPIMIGVAAIGVVINTVTALLFLSGHEDLNIRGAFLHMAADAGISLGVVLAGIAIALTGAGWIDPVMSLVIVAVILWGTWGLFRESLDLAIDAVPRGIDPGQVEDDLRDHADVHDVHDLHIWALSTTETALTAHLVVPEAGSQRQDAILCDIAGQLRERFGIRHATLQIERGDPENPCPRLDDPCRDHQAGRDRSEVGSA